MSAINFGTSVSLSDFAHAVATVGHEVTIIGEGEMGIGKSATLKTLAKMMPNHAPAYIDCTLLDLGDFALPFIEQWDPDAHRESTGQRIITPTGLKVTRFAPNARFKLHLGQPVIVMLDELGKAMKSVKNVLLTLMLEHRIGDHYLPEGSIVFATTNLGAEGIGDFLEPHARNRAAKVRIGKSDADQWVNDYAIPHNLDATVIAWVKQFPHCLAAFDDPSQRDNPYINHPGRAGQDACVTPRTLEKASCIVAKRAVLGESLTLSMLTGTIGQSAARDMQAFLTVADKLPTWEAIVASPNTAKLPTDPVAKCIMVFSAVTRIERDTLSSWMDYLNRMDKEWQALFAKSVMRSPAKQAFCVTNRSFKDWALQNEYLF